jgi:hypothetical protein
MGTMLAFSMQACIPKYTGKPVYKKSESIDVEALKKDYILVGSQQSATVGNYFIGYIPVKLGLSSEEGDTENRLMQDLLKRFDADLLTNVSIKKNYIFTIYWNQWTREIVADVWKKKGKL